MAQCFFFQFSLEFSFILLQSLSSNFPLPLFKLSFMVNGDAIKHDVFFCYSLISMQHNEIRMRTTARDTRIKQLVIGIVFVSFSLAFSFHSFSLCKLGLCVIVVWCWVCVCIDVYFSIKPHRICFNSRLMQYIHATQIGIRATI